MSRSLGSKGRRDRLASVFLLPDHQVWVCVESGGGPPLGHRERNISRHGTVTGKLRWSPRFDFHVEADGGGYWMLDVPSRMTAEVDALIYTRVIVRGIRIGFADLYLLRIEEDFRPDR